MTTQKAIEVLKEYQSWRLGAETEQLSPKIVTEAINILIAEVEKQPQYPSEEDINEYLDRYAFRVPYDGSNKFYDEDALKHCRNGITWAIDKWKESK